MSDLDVSLALCSVILVEKALGRGLADTEVTRACYEAEELKLKTVLGRSHRIPKPPRVWLSLGC